MERRGFVVTFTTFPVPLVSFPTFDCANRCFAWRIFFVSFPSQENSFGVLVKPRPRVKL